MDIEGTAFGSITIDGETMSTTWSFELSGEVVKRKKKLSKKYYGTSHVLSKDEAKFVFERGCEQLIVGSGQMGNVHLSPEAEAYFAKMGCKVLLQPTPEAIHLEPISKSSEEDNEAGELDKAEEVLSVVLPADEDATLPLYPGEEALDEPAPLVTA